MQVGSRDVESRQAREDSWRIQDLYEYDDDGCSDCWIR